ncbi:MAG: sterol desaturase family protein [Alphaproteobacteria bacterium]|nr:sterol desaturase family protein [Alphaproteobacteria bacterium]
MRTVISYVIWPLLLGIAISALSVGFVFGHPVIAFNLSYLTLAGVLLILERVMPHEERWLSYDGQLVADLGHTLLSKTAVQVLVVSLAMIGATEMVSPTGATWWPGEWPLWAQILIGLVAAEFGFYWAHRLAHEWPLLWRFHAIHHSAKRLWVVNTGRFHFVDTIVSTSFGLAVAFLVGAPESVIMWVSAITAYIGVLTHCNIAMRGGILSYVFNTPELHRWHHSMVPEEGNRNYGENLMLFDQIFGTYINPDRRPPAEIGIHDSMPASLLGQVTYPFRSRRPTAPAAE